MLVWINGPFGVGKTDDGYGLAALLGRTDTWALERIGPCLDALASERFARHVDTDERTVDDVVEDVADALGLALARPRLPPARREVHRLATTLRHIRW